MFDQNWETALFTEYQSTAATIEAAKGAAMYSCFPGHNIEVRDVEQAYIQADMQGTPVWIVLPEELWTTEMWAMHARGECLVVRLDKALYGHKNSGFDWQEFCDAACRDVGFELVGASWPSVYFHEATKVLLIVYVDDMLMSGPSHAFGPLWKALGEKIKLEEPPGKPQEE